jgi:hypothetical protein
MKPGGLQPASLGGKISNKSDNSVLINEKVHYFVDKSKK